MVPAWAASMIFNYRYMFTKRYGTDCKLSDDQIYKITQEVFDDSSTKFQDEARVEEMFNLGG